MIVEPWAPARREEIERRFGPPGHWSHAQGRARWGHESAAGRWAATIVVIDPADDRPVAVASGFRPRLHAGRDWCYVEVAPEARGHGFGAVALDALRAAAPADVRPLRAKVAAGSAGSRFATHHGFTPIQRNRTIRVARFVDARIDDTLDADVVPAHRVGGDVVDAWISYYRDGHDWDPPGHLSAELGRELFFAGPDDLVAVARSDGVIVGVGCVVRGGDRPVFVGGSVARHDADAPMIASVLLSHASSGADSPEFDVELDDWMWEIEAALAGHDTAVVDTAFVVAEQ